MATETPAGPSPVALRTCTETIANVSSFVGRDLLNGKVRLMGQVDVWQLTAWEHCLL